MQSAKWLSSNAVSRREMLWRCANGFGGLALSCLLAEKQGLAAGTLRLLRWPPEPLTTRPRPGR